jgi:hypothetical protein
MKQLFLKKKKLLISMFALTFVTSAFIPSAHAASADPWYIAPLAWILDFLLGILGGIHDPMDHVFYNGCGIAGQFFGTCQDRSIWGMFTPQQFSQVIYRGFLMFAAVATFIVFASVIKSGVLLSLRNLSSTLKFEVTDTMIKTLIAIVLMAQFFTITNSMFKVNDLFVGMVKTDLTGSTVVRTLNSATVVPGDGRTINGRIEMNSLSQGLSETSSPIAKAAVSLASRGVAIWWEVYYLQRKLMIALLVILAPLWICCMFYPMLHGVTFAAFKELWSQIIAQAIHATLFWGYFHLIDNQMGWFDAIVAMSLFIPISESIRFIFGATSGAGGKLAAIGTMTGAAGIMNMTKAVSSIGKGGINAFKAYNGMPTGNASNKLSKGIASFANPASSSGVGGGGGGGGSADPGMPKSSLERKIRASGEIGAGLGSAFLRTGLGFAGAGLGPAGAFFGGEAGDKLGDAVGYRGGVASYAGGKTAVSGMKEMGSRISQIPTNFNEAYNEISPRDGDRSARIVKAAHMAVGGAKKDSPPMTFEQQQAAKAESRERSAERWGIAGEALQGRGGYAAGDAFGRTKNSGRTLSPAKLADMRDVKGVKQIYTVETEGSSYLAEKDSNTGEYTPISNFGRGNPALAKGQTVVTAHNIQGQGNAIRLSPVKEQVNYQVEGSDRPHSEFVNSSHMYTESGKASFAGKTVDPNQFIGPSNPNSNTDLRRKNFISKL